MEIHVFNAVLFFPPSELGRDHKTEALSQKEYQHAQTAVDWAIQELKRATPHVAGEVRRAVGVVDDIVDAIERFEADLVVMGHRGLSRIERFFLGSTSENVLRHAPCSVWIVREHGS